MSKEKECKCCKRIWYEDMLDKKWKLYPNCYEYYKPLIDNLKIKDKQIADLETKLAESEKQFIVANNLRKNSDEVLLNYKTEKYGLDKTIQELRKMKLSLPEKEWYYKGFENCERQMSSHIADLTLEVKQLKQQLHDLPKKIVGEITNELSNNTSLYFEMRESTSAHCPNKEYEWFNYVRFRNYINTILKKYGGEDEINND